MHEPPNSRSAERMENMWWLSLARTLSSSSVACRRSSFDDSTCITTVRTSAPRSARKPRTSRTIAFALRRDRRRATGLATIHTSALGVVGTPADDRMRPKTGRFIGADTRDPLHRRRIGTDPDSHAVSRALVPATCALALGRMRARSRFGVIVSWVHPGLIVSSGRRSSDRPPALAGMRSGS